jgi:hypothetical protein
MRLSLLAVVTIVCANAAPAQSPPSPPWWFGTQAVSVIRVPAAIRKQLDGLGYTESDSIKGIAFDLNGDGVLDFLVQSAPSLCGNGGCSYDIFDGATSRDLGQVFGGVLYFHAAKVRGLPLIDALSHRNAESATYTTYAFSGSRYRIVSARTLQGAALDSLQTALHRIPQWRPDTLHHRRFRRP